jgi:hypothetical protein
MKTLRELSDKIMEVSFEKELRYMLSCPGDEFVREILGHEDDFDYEEWYKQTRLAYFWIKRWYCTDSEVGTRAYLFNGRIVVFSRQAGRKCDEEFMWVCEDDFRKVKGYLEEFVVKPNRKFDIADGDYLQSIMSEVGGYRIDKYCELCHHEAAWLGDLEVSIPNGWDSCPDREAYNKCWWSYDDVIVILPGGDKHKVKMSDLIFKEIQ